MSRPIIIAIDGHSSTGKSTLAKALAAELGYAYVDSGAMYRAVALYCLRAGVRPTDEAAVVALLPHIHIGFRRVGGANHAFLNGEDVENEIRQHQVSASVSHVAAIGPVRRKLVEQQQAMGRARGLVMDGRDICTVVFPDAELKIFMTADAGVRALRRQKELAEKGQVLPLATVRQNLEERDHIDSTRDVTPMRQTEDAHLLDNSAMSHAEQLALALRWAKDAIAAAQAQC